MCPPPTGVEDCENRGALLYNEYIVYNVAQIRVKYLLQMKFNYTTTGRRH